MIADFERFNFQPSWMQSVSDLQDGELVAANPSAADAICAAGSTIIDETTTGALGDFEEKQLSLAL